MGLLSQLMPIDVLVLHCPLCSFHSYLLNSIEQHFGETHPNKMIDYIIYRCAICHKVSSCHHFMHEHISLIHNKHTSSEHDVISNGHDDSSIFKSTSCDPKESYSDTAFISICFSGKLYSKSQKSNSSADSRPCSRTNSDSDDRLYKCIFCKSLHHSFQQLQFHYVSHGIRIIGGRKNKEGSLSDEANGCYTSEKNLNLIDTEDNDEEVKCKPSFNYRQELNEVYSIDRDSTSQDQHVSNKCTYQLPQKSIDRITTSLQSHSSLLNLIMQHSANQSPQSLVSEEKASTPNIENVCSVELSSHFPPKVSPHNSRINASDWLSGLNAGQLITSPILSNLHNQFGLPSLRQHMMNVYGAGNSGSPATSTSNAGFICISPNTNVSVSNLLSLQVDANNSGNTPDSPSFSNNELFQIPKRLPSVFSSVMTNNGTNQIDASVDLSNNHKNSNDKVQSSSDSDRSSFSLSPNDKFQHTNNRTKPAHCVDTSPSKGKTKADDPTIEESQLYSMKRVVGLSRTNLPFQARKVLFGWLTSHLREPYPSEEEKIRLANETGLSRTTVNNWFINARRRYVKPLLQGKLGMTSGVLKSMLENNSGIMENHRSPFPLNVISSGLKRKSVSNSSERGESLAKRQCNNHNKSGKGDHSNTVDAKYNEMPKVDSIENIVTMEKDPTVSSIISDFKVDQDVGHQNTLSQLVKLSETASFDI